MKRAVKMFGGALLLAASMASYADGAGTINDIHWAFWDQDQSNTICFEINGVGLAFVSNGSDKAKAVISLLISSYQTGRTVTYSSVATPMSQPPCQSWEIPANIYQVTAFSFQ